MEENDALQRMEREKYMKERLSHDEFLQNRPWDLVESIWKNLLLSNTRTVLPQFVQGDGEYGMTDLQAINAIGQAEFSSKDPKFKRHTFAFSIGYLGSAYTGYQQQRGVEGILTVEDDLDTVLGRKVVAAGRTDKGVSALSQVVSYTSFDTTSTPAQLLRQSQATDACRSGRLAVWDCQRVPRKFHPLFAATWRRYLYLFPLCSGPFSPHGVDVDVDFVNEAFQRLQGEELPYNGFAHRENRATGEGLSDLCTLFRARAFFVDVAVTFCSLVGSSPFVMCIELVGDRFLRRMVRILVATAVRESVLSNEIRNVNILRDIAVSRERNKAAAAAPGAGLALCGVGYDLVDLADIRMKPKVSKQSHKSINDPDTLDNETSKDDVNTSTNKRKRNKPFDHGSSSKRATGQMSYVVAANTASLNLPPESGIQITYATNEDWLHYCEELVAHDPELLFHPERSFHFPHISERLGRPISLLLPQTMDNVGTTIWDAETLLAHYLDRWLSWSLEVSPAQLSSASTVCTDTPVIGSVLELGAGTALAALLCECYQVTRIVAQETEEVLPQLKALLQRQQSSVLPVAGLWGEELVAQLRQQSRHDVSSEVDSVFSLFDCILMADVFYHPEHFDALVQTVTGLLQPGSGSLLVVFEQRRRNLSDIILRLAHYFRQHRVLQFNVFPKLSADGPEDISDGNYGGKQKTTTFYLCHFERFVAP